MENYEFNFPFSIFRFQLKLFRHRKNVVGDFRID
jgi:hypothetical protein